MIEQFLIFNKGGLVLWSKTFSPVQGSPVNNLIQSIFLEERVTEQSFVDGKYTLKWSLANDVGLVFVVVLQTTLASSVKYTDDLLRAVKKIVLSKYRKELADTTKQSSLVDFDDKFSKILMEVENLHRGGKQTQTEQRTQQEQNTYQTATSKFDKVDNVPEKAEFYDTSASADSDTQDSAEEESSILSPEERAKFLAKKGSRKGKVTQPSPSKSKAPPAAAKKKPTKILAEPSKKRLTAAEIEALNRGPDKNMELAAGPQNVGTVELDDDVNLDEEIDEKKATGGVLSYFRSLTGAVLGRELTREDVQPVLDQMKDHLIKKNVAVEIAQKICESVAANLIGKQLGSFTRVSSTVRDAMRQALTQILTPKKQIDILREINDVNSKGGVYSIVFVGVNGVGKSTSLAKVCAWLKQQGKKVMICACDTFRAGAIEQLQLHSVRLDVPLFQGGYGVDAAAVARSGLQHAKQKGFDVVLIDTAGRMQGREDLMQALGNVISINRPNLIMFVGEALVGNDSVDQLIKFNEAIEKHGSKTEPRAVDGIFLTKFDTVDDKVGAAISMVYTSRAPILFVGVGQQYTDIKTLNTNKIVQVLLQGK